MVHILGGVFGLFDGRMEDIVATATASKVKAASEVLPELCELDNGTQ
jgi:hypothetical protein